MEKRKLIDILDDMHTPIEKLQLLSVAFRGDDGVGFSDETVPPFNEGRMPSAPMGFWTVLNESIIELRNLRLEAEDSV